MNGELPADSTAVLRRAVYGLLIVSVCATLVARVTQVESTSGKTPFLSANDRSRWSTIRALVEQGTFSLDDIIYKDGGEAARIAPTDPSINPLRQRISDWYSIDMARHRGRDGQEHAYSTKPPLMSVLLAGEYWLVRAITGAQLGDRPLYVGRLMLVISNILPLAAAWWLLSKQIDRLGRTDWGRAIVFTAATWGTLLTPMAVTLNNHLWAAICVIFALAAVVEAWNDEEPRLRPYVVAGLAAALLAAQELPALSLFCLIAASLAWRSPRSALIGFAPAAIVVAVAALGTNYWAHGTLKPAYAHRSDGPVLALLTANHRDDVAAGRATAEMRRQLSEQNLTLSDDLHIRQAGEGRWQLWDAASQTRYAVRERGTTTSGHSSDTSNDAAKSASSLSAELEVRRWDNWYDYEGTYWTDERLAGVDRGEASRAVYAFHSLVGHHGLLSLTPFWLLSLIGCGIWAARGSQLCRGIAGVTVVASVVVFGFYMARPLIDRNYGGVSCGLRWMFWFAPLWLVTALPAADALASSRFGRWFALLLLAASVFSAQWSGLHPWSHPWLFDYWTRLGWLTY